MNNDSRKYAHINPSNTTPTGARGASVSDTALRLCRLGLAVLPVQAGSKKPIGKEWQSQPRRTEAEIQAEAGEWMALGVLNGLPSGSYVDVDLDSEVARRLAPGFLPPTGMIYGRPGRPASHFGYLARGLLSTQQFKDLDGKVILELRSTGTQTLLPPSPHPDGGAYSWDSEGEPAVVDSEVLVRAATKLSTCALLAKNWPAQGSRHHMALAVAGLLLPHLQVDEVVEIVTCAAQEAGDEEWPQRVTQVHSTATALEKGNPVTGHRSLAELTSDKLVGTLRKWHRIPGSASGGGRRASQRDRQAEALIAIGSEFDLFVDERDMACASVVDNGRRRICRLDSADFKEQLALRYFEKTERAAAPEVMRSSLAVLTARAKRTGISYRLYNRIARTKTDEIFIDLRDSEGRAVKVTPMGWEVIGTPPILFRRYAHQKALPLPERGGNADEILSFLNVRHAEDKVLVLVWLAVAFFEDVPRCALMLHGPAGSAKTTAARMLRSLIDPSEAPVQASSRRENEFQQVCDHNAVVLLDNVTSVSQAESDTFCKVITGDGVSKRRLYTDDDDIIMSFKRLLIMTAINVPADFPDLLDRCILIELQRLGHDVKSESSLLAAFEAARPGIFAGVLDVLVKVLAMQEKVLPVDGFRMADFTRYGNAAADALHFGGDDFVRALHFNRSRQAEQISEDPLVIALCRFMSARSEWSGTSSELYEEIKSYHSEEHKRDRWPCNPQQLSKRITTLDAVLETNGIKVAHPPRSASQRRIVLTRAIRKVSEAGPVAAAMAEVYNAFSGDPNPMVRSLKELVN